MMRKAYLGLNALILLVLHTGIFALDLMDLFPYSRTVFFPMLCLLPLLMGIVGWYEKDRLKWPAILATLISLAMITYWIIALILRLQAQTPALQS